MHLTSKRSRVKRARRVAKTKANRAFKKIKKEMDDHGPIKATSVRQHPIK